MTAAVLTNACPVCGAEESLDMLLMRMVEDDEVRRLITEVLTLSLPLGGLVARYLRLHKPAKQRLRMDRVAQLLQELVPDMRRGAITRKGRDWAAPVETWKLAFAAVFEAVEKGTLTAPVNGNAYLYEVVMRMTDRYEAELERRNEADRKHSATTAGTVQSPTAAADLVVAVRPPAAAATPLASTTPPPGPSSYARRMQAQIAAMKERSSAPIDSTTDERKEP